MADSFVHSENSCVKKILVVGLTCIDIKNVVDHFPMEDEDMRTISQTWTPGGNAVNTSCVLAQHNNFQVDLLSGLSSRKEHAFILDELQKASVNIDLCAYHDFLLPTSTCILNLKTGSRTILCCRNDFPLLRLEDFFKVNINDYYWIHFEGRDFPDIGEMINIVINKRGASNKPVISGEMEKVKRMSDLDRYVLPTVDVLVVSKDIAHGKNYKSALETVEAISSNKGIEAKFIICPWGDKGAAGAQIVENEWKFYECNADTTQNVVDTLGAGDTFNAGVIISLMQGMNCLDSIQYACKLAGKKCGQIGFQSLVTTLS